MADQEGDKKDAEIPSFKFTAKKVDDSWKEEARREREAIAANAAAKSPARPAEPARPAAGAQAGADAPAGKPAAAAKGAAKEDGKPQQSAAEQQQSKIFMTFLAGLAQQALMQMGEMENPYSGQREVDLNGARYTIELLNTIQAKTKGNLSAEENEGLSDAIHDLKMRYVQIAQEVQRQMQAQMAKGGPGGAPGGGRRPGPGGSIPGMR